MSIPLDGMVGYIRTRTKPSTVNKRDKDGKPAPELELWIDQNVVMTMTPSGPVVGKPKDCTGILYSANGKLEVRYPE